MYYEIIYETGEHSIAQYDSDDEAVEALREHHRRALSGERFQTRSPQDAPAGPATRIKRVIKYDRHPADLTESGLIDADKIAPIVDMVGVGGQASVHELTAALREELNPTLPESAPHESNYKMKEVGELDPTVWQGSEAA
jgi:hypothetical protein